MRLKLISMQEQWGQIAPLSSLSCSAGKIPGYVSTVQTWDEVRKALLAAKHRGDQKRIASRLDVDPSTVTRFLQGKQAPSFEAVRVMAEVIGLDLSRVAAPLDLPEGLAERISAAVSSAVVETITGYGSPKKEPGSPAKRERGAR